MSPRIRYRRSYDFELYEQSDEGTSSEESASGNSWLSNATIASQLSDAKIKTTIAALKAQITVLEAELLSRHFTHSHQSGKNWDTISRTRQRKDEERLYPRINRQLSKRNSAQFKKIASLRATLKKLGVKDVDALLTEWSKIVGKEK